MAEERCAWRIGCQDRADWCVRWECLGTDSLVCDDCAIRLAGLVTRARGCGIDLGRLWFAPLAPRPGELPVLVPDPGWWAAWQRWAQMSDRRDARGQ